MFLKSKLCKFFETKRLVHDLQPFNAVTICTAGLPPKLDEFVEPFTGSSCYIVLDLYSEYDGHKLDSKS